MLKFVGETVEEAIQKGLKELHLAKEDVEIVIVEEGKKGFLGIGKKEAEIMMKPLQIEKDTSSELPKVEVAEETVSEPEVMMQAEVIKQTELSEIEKVSNDEAVTQLALYLTNITKELGAPALVRISREEEVIVFHLDSEKQGMLIGKHGKVLNALQYLAQVFVHRIAENKLTIVVNVGDYREKREATLKRLANNTAEKVKRTGRSVFLEPMPAFERKQIHAILSEDDQVKTHSEGDEPYRYLVVEPQKTIL